MVYTAVWLGYFILFNQMDGKYRVANGFIALFVVGVMMLLDVLV